MRLCGEGGEVDKEDPVLLAELDALYKLISTFDPENVYNMDETGLFFRILPSYTLLLKSESKETTRGRKQAKERVSITVCSNSTGTHKLPCTMIEFLEILFSNVETAKIFRKVRT